MRVLLPVCNKQAKNYIDHQNDVYGQLLRHIGSRSIFVVVIFKIMVLGNSERQVVGVAEVSVKQAQVYYKLPVRYPVSLFGVYNQLMVPPLFYRLLLFVVVLARVFCGAAVAPIVLLLLLLLPHLVEKYNKVVSSFSHLVDVGS